MTRLVLALLAVLAAAGPAMADPVGKDPVADTPRFTFIPIPLPFLAVGAMGTVENLAIGPTRNDFQFLGGYFWSRNFLYDPASAVPRPPTGVGAEQVTTNDWRVVTEWDVHLCKGLTLGPALLVHGGGALATGTFDPDLAGGFSAQAGPALRWRALDETAFPTQGTAADLVYSYGRYFGTATTDFQKGGLNAIHYLRLAPNQTLAVRGTLQAGGPRLAWLDKFEAGGGDFVRGYQWNRFTGDRLAAASLEYRNLFIADLAAPLGLKLPIVPGLAFTAHVDAGRAWDAAVGLPVGSDPRFGGGIGLVGTLDRAPLGRLELNVSPEGIFPVVELSTSY
ncbi:MAG: polymerase [Cyanobacteria bacterium RYN_339]|nr:polymerase [Cyanobacteria bacterium RYN_339]